MSTSVPDVSTPTLQAPINSDANSSAPIALDTSGDSALVSHGGPSGTTADVVGTTQSYGNSVYVVRSGDTLGEIAKMFDVSVNTIIWANKLSSAGDVHPGDTLIILPISGIQHTVVKGDTLKSIAKKYGADANEIAQFNYLDSSVPLEVGSTIIVPGGGITPTVSSPKSSSVKAGNEPYLGGSGPAQPGYYANPLPGARINQGIHGWNAVDLGGPGILGAPIHAAADGIVKFAYSNGRWNGGYGNYVVIAHSNGTQTLYAHMRSAIVSPGQSVSSGQVIGYVGTTGMSTGPHLHFEVRGAANPFRNCSVGSVCEPQ